MAPVAVMWGEAPPPHAVVAALSLKDSVYTASSDGAIIRWEGGDGGRFRPVAMLSGHSDAVVALCAAQCEDGGAGVLSVGYNGLLLMWQVRTSSTSAHGGMGEPFRRPTAGRRIIGACLRGGDLPTP